MKSLHVILSLCSRWRLRVTSWLTVLSSTFAERPCCGARLKACHAHPPSNTWRHCGKRSTQPARSVPWASTHWPSRLCIARTGRTRSSPGSTSSVATCTATTTGATTTRRGRAGTGSVPCVEPKGPTCRCGWAASQGFTSTLPHPPTPSTPAATFAQRRRQPSGVRSHCHTAHTPSTLPALSAPNS